MTRSVAQALLRIDEQCRRPGSRAARLPPSFPRNLFRSHLLPVNRSVQQTTCATAASPVPKNNHGCRPGRSTSTVSVGDIPNCLRASSSWRAFIPATSSVQWPTPPRPSPVTQPCSSRKTSMALLATGIPNAFVLPSPATAVPLAPTVCNPWLHRRQPPRPQSPRCRDIAPAPAARARAVPQSRRQPGEQSRQTPPRPGELAAALPTLRPGHGGYTAEA